MKQFLRRNIQFILMAMLALFIVGCTPSAVLKKEEPKETAAESKEAKPEQMQETKAEGEKEAKAEEKSESKTEDGSEEIIITDMAGREVRLPKAATRALTDSPTSQRLYTYINGLNDLVGVSARDAKNLTDRPYALANPEILDMKSFAGGYFIEDWEAALLAKPDVIFADQSDASMYDKIQAQTGCPVVALDYGSGVVFDPKLYQSLEIIGKVMGKEERAKEVVDYMESLKKDLQNRTKDIPESERKNVYAAGLAWNGPHGIEGTRENYPIFDVIHANNVVKGIGKDGLVEVDKEQIIKWNPEYIFVDLASIHLIQADYLNNKEYYQSLEAFKNQKVFAQLSFVWCDINIDTAMGISYYVGKTIYPDRFADIDPIEKVNEIYTFLVGKPVYEEMAKTKFGGYQEVTLEALDANTYFKEVKK